MEEQLFVLNDFIRTRQVIELCKFDDNIILYKMNARSMIQICLDWSENRVLDDNRITEIINEYRNNNKVLLSSLFRAFYDTQNNKLVLIDGHHRKSSLIEIFKTDTNREFNPMILLTIHKFDVINEEILQKLHIDSNLSKALEEYQIPSIARSILINKIKKDNILVNGISKTPNARTAQYPKLSLNELAELSGKLLMKFPEIKRTEDIIKINEIINDIITKLKQINNFLSLIFVNDNYGKLGYGLNKKEKDRINKCAEYNFYLNMKESKYSIENWINYIINPRDYFIELQTIVD